MKKKLLSIICFFFLPAYSGTALAQIPFDGQVVDYLGTPLPGIIIQVEGTDKGTISNENGYYSIDINHGDFLIFSSTGTKTREMYVNTFFLVPTGAMYFSANDQHIPTYYNNPEPDDTKDYIGKNDIPQLGVAYLGKKNNVKTKSYGKATDYGTEVLKEIDNNKKKGYTYTFEKAYETDMKNFSLRSSVNHTSPNKYAKKSPTKNFFSNGINLKNSMEYRSNPYNGLLFGRYTNQYNTGIVPSAKTIANTFQVDYSNFKLKIDAFFDQTKHINTQDRGNHVRRFYSQLSGTNEFDNQNTFSNKNNYNYYLNGAYQRNLGNLFLYLKSSFQKQTQDREIGFTSTQATQYGRQVNNINDNSQVSIFTKLSYRLYFIDIQSIEMKFSHQNFNTSDQIFTLQQSTGQQLNKGEMLYASKQNNRRNIYELNLNHQIVTYNFSCSANFRTYKSNTYDKILFQPKFSISYSLPYIYWIAVDKIELLGTYKRYITEAQFQDRYNHFNTINHHSSNFLTYFEQRSLLIPDKLQPSQSDYYKAELKFKNHFFSFFANYYYENVHNAIYPVQSARNISLENLANLRNREGNISFSYDSNYYGYDYLSTLTFHKKRTIVTKIHSSQSYLPIAGFQDVHKSLIENEQVGVIVGSKYSRTDDGQIALDSSGEKIIRNDLGIIANPNPDWTISFNTDISKNLFTLNFNLEYTHGGQIWNGSKQLRHAQNGLTAAEDYVEDASCFRINNLTLSYTIPQKITKKLHLHQVLVSVWSKNLVAYTPYSGVDPESQLMGYDHTSGLDLFNIPNQKQFGFQLEVTF